MEEKINISAILKDKPQGTKLYDWLHNIDIELDTISTTDTETVVWCTNETNNNTTCHRGYSEFGTERGYPDGLQILFPSKEMRDWNKFAWKKGDILVSNDSDCHIIFEGFSKDDYTTFKGKHWVSVSKKRHISFMNMQNTQNYYIEDDKDAAQTYINTIEERLGGKLNRETLEIEKQTEFKDGDILYVKTKKLGSEYIIINKLSKEAKTAFYVAYNLSSKKIFWNLIYFVCCDKEISILRQATDYEKSQLFDALAKKNKAWDAGKKQIVDLKQKVDELKPFDKVLVRDYLEDKWMPNFFSCYDGTSEYKYGCIAGNSDNVVFSKYCIPYNEETAHLLGTTDEWKEGE